MSENLLILLLCIATLMLLAFVTLPSIYRIFRCYHRLYTLTEKADRKMQAGDVTGARLLLEAALSGDDGLKGSPTQRQKRRSVEYALARVHIEQKNYREALESVEQTDLRYKAEEYAWSRAYSAYLRSFAVANLGDARGARELRQTATSLFKEYGESAELTYLLARSTHDRVLDLFRLGREGRPTQALGEAVKSLSEPALTEWGRGYLEFVAGFAERALGDIVASNTHYELAFQIGTHDGDSRLQPQGPMELALNATYAADREATLDYKARMEAAYSDVDAMTQCNYLLTYTTIPMLWGDDFATGHSLAEAIAEIDRLLTTVPDGEDVQTIRLRLSLLRVHYGTSEQATEADVREAKLLVTEMIASPETAESHFTYLLAIDLLGDVRFGRCDDFPHRLQTVEAQIAAFLAVRPATDESVLRHAYEALIEACLAAVDFEQAAHYIERFARLRVYPIDVPKIAYWRGCICLGGGDLVAANKEFRAAVAAGLGTHAEQNAARSLDVLENNIAVGT